MKRFSFRLERLLRLKQEAENQQAQQLSRSMDIETEKKRRAAESAQRRHVAECQVARLRGQNVVAGTLRAAEHALRAVRGQADQHGRDHRTAAANVTKERRKFHRARQERMSLERLRDKQHADWIADVSRHEQSSIDEIASRMNLNASRGPS